MLRVVSVSDKVGTAIDRLCRGVAKYHDNLEYIVCDVHPKRPDPEQLARFEQAIKSADIIDYQYFRTADMLRERYPALKDIPSILTHNNPYSINERDWNDYEIVVANNLTMQADLSRITNSRLEYIPLTSDTDFWTFNQKWEPENQVLMVANRIESKKGILPVAIACAELGIKFVLVGNISHANYFNDIQATGNIEFYENITDEQLRELYYKSKLHICNSQDNFESGTLPILEAMLCGTPVMTRRVGHVPDLYNSENMYLYEGDSENVPELISQIKLIFSDNDITKVRDKAWNTVKTRSFERRAYGYQKLYRSLQSDKTPVSVIMPIYNRADVYTQAIEAVFDQDYPNIELIVCNDNPDDKENNQHIAELQKLAKIPFKYINQPSEGYGIAKQRNLGIIEATGDILIFCDERVVMNKKAVSEFVKGAQPRVWQYGTKGFKKDFVENFSAVNRDDIVKIGGFNERIDLYGGQSQEVRSRAKYNGYQIQFNEKAKAELIGKSSNRWRKKDEIIKMKNKLWKIGLEL